MGRKTKAPRPSRAARAAEETDYKTWLADAVAELQRKHNINPSIIPIRVWRRLYIQGRTPHDAADKAAVSAHNARLAANRLKRR
jgi:transposase-like protein